MAAPTYVSASTGATDAAGAWAFTGQTPAAIGNIFILQIVQDGNTGTAVTLTAASHIENLAGTDNAWTQINGSNGDNSHPIGSAAVARQHIFIGRSIDGTAPTASGGNSTSEDLFIRSYQFSGVNTGATLASVIESGSAGVATNGAGTGTSVADTGVTTLGVDRLALQLVGVNLNVTIAAFTGQSGGTWAEAVAEYSSASGTAACLQLQTATITAAGTINGGTATISSAGWGVVGLALIPVAVATADPFPYVAGGYYPSEG